MKIEESVLAVLSQSEIDPLPDNSFKESGTLVNTVVVTIHN